MNEVGGAKRDRTADLYNAIVALSQLSYSPPVLVRPGVAAGEPLSIPASWPRASKK